jgi:hypothetical protein
MAPPPGLVWRRARRPQDRFARACGGGLRCAPASLDRGCARRLGQSQVGTEKRCFDRTKKLAVDAVLGQPPELQLANVTVTIPTGGENNAQASHRRSADDHSPTPGATPGPAPPVAPAAPGAAGAGASATAETLGGGGSDIDRPARRIPRLARQSADQPRRVETGREAASHCRARPRGAAVDRPTARLRSRLT